MCDLFLSSEEMKYHQCKVCVTTMNLGSFKPTINNVNNNYLRYRCQIDVKISQISFNQHNAGRRNSHSHPHIVRLRSKSTVSALYINIEKDSFDIEHAWQSLQDMILRKYFHCKNIQCRLLNLHCIHMENMLQVLFTHKALSHERFKPLRLAIKPFEGLHFVVLTPLDPLEYNPKMQLIKVVGAFLSKTQLNLGEDKDKSLGTFPLFNPTTATMPPARKRGRTVSADGEWRGLLIVTLGLLERQEITIDLPEPSFGNNGNKIIFGEYIIYYSHQLMNSYSFPDVVRRRQMGSSSSLGSSVICTDSSQFFFML
ncbi:hypothetical protein GQR58_011533 [Nymphon striatum]|nr:hypothetical protein GQR58_011533 [Nymphon striatum]